ncbi:MAG: hypothetical protein GX220_07880 [Treponema sp.]|nr:hypothetical protein [Treponema sp.]
MKKHLIFLLLILINFCAYSATINIIITQDDGVQTDVREVSKVFEDTILDAGFEQGHIICNEIINLEKNIKVVSQKAFDAASNGYCDYLVTFYLVIEPITEKALSVSWELIRIIDGKILNKGDYKFPKAKSSSFDDEMDNLILNTNNLCTEIFASIGRN